MSVTHTLNTAEELDSALIILLSRGSAQVTIGSRLAARLTEVRRAVLAAAGRGGPVYGVSTGMGALSGVALTAEQQRDHSVRLLAGRAAGGPPWLPAPEVRALYAVRLRTFLNGDAGVSAELCQRLADLLTDLPARGLVPAVPAEAAGSAGEIVQLAHAFGPLAGLGSVLSGGMLIPAAEVVPPFGLGPKEGIALLAGVPGATALSLLAVAEAGQAAALLEAAAALSAAAAGAPPGPFAAACARGDDVLGAVLARLRGHYGELARPPRMLQAPVSFRVAGPVLAQVARATDALTAATGRALAGVTDSPAFLDDEFVGTGGFHGIDLAAQCDHLAAAIAHAAEVSAARTHRLLDPRVTGLAAQLAARPGPDAGLVAVHKRAAGEVHALRRLAVPSALGTIETSGGQEDVQSFAWAAACALRAAVRRARVVAACELLCGYQAATLAGLPRRGLVAAVGGLAEPVTADRPLGPDIERLVTELPVKLGPDDSPADSA